MFMRKRFSVMISGAALSALLTACAGFSKVPEVSKTPTMTPAEEILLEQIETQFHEGDYKTVIKTVKEAPETTLGGLAFRTDALKYKAFSECVSRQPRNCRSSFRRLLELNSDFDLTPAEANHPQWGKVFIAEKKRSDAAAAKASATLQEGSSTDSKPLSRATTMPRSEIRIGPRQRTNTND